jgi:hypothetical protein
MLPAGQSKLALKEYVAPCRHEVEGMLPVIVVVRIAAALLPRARKYMLSAKHDCEKYLGTQ